MLTVAPRLSAETYAETFNYLRSCSGMYFTIVIVQKSTDQVRRDVLDLALITDRGMWDHCSSSASSFAQQAKSGHIEDIAVSKTLQGRKLGPPDNQRAREIGRSQGCYKIILIAARTMSVSYADRVPLS